MLRSMFMPTWPLNGNFTGFGIVPQTESAPKCSASKIFSIEPGFYVIEDKNPEDSFPEIARPLVPGMFIGFRLAKELLMSLYPSGSEAAQAFLALRDHTYQGLITSVSLSLPDGEPTYLLGVRFVLEHRSAAFFEPDRAFPIFPAGQNNVQPLETLPYFPFDDCYVSTISSVELVVPLILIEESIFRHELDTPEFERLGYKAGVFTGEQAEPQPMCRIPAFVYWDLTRIDAVCDPVWIMVDCRGVAKVFHDYPHPKMLEVQSSDKDVNCPDTTKAPKMRMGAKKNYDHHVTKT